MLNHTHIVFCPVLVLTLGLMSCKKSDDVMVEAFRIPEPIWHTDNGDVKFSDQKTRDHKLQDELDFSASPAATVVVDSHCETEKRTSNASVKFEIPTKIRLFSMLPRENLSPTLASQNARCDLDFRAVNSDGARHVFHESGVRIIDDGGEIDLRSASTTPEFQEREFSSSRFFTLSTSKTAFVLRCDDFETKSLREKNSEIWLSDFDYSKALRSRPFQRCRILASNGRYLNAMSSPFRLTFQGIMPEIKYSPVQTHFGDYPFGGPMVILNFEMTNNSKEKLYFQMPTPPPKKIRGFTFDVNLAYHAQPDGGERLACPQDSQPLMTSLLLTEKDGQATITPALDGYIIEMAPGSSIEGSIQINASTYGTPPNWVFAPAAPFELQILQNDHGSIESQIRHWGDFGVSWFASTQAEYNHFHWSEKTHLACELPASAFDD